MKKGVIFDTEEHAKQADWDANSLTGSITKYRYNRLLLQDTTTLTKAEYAALYSIPQSEQAALENSYTLHKCAWEVGDTHDIIDPDTGESTVPSYVVDVSGMLLSDN